MLEILQLAVANTTVARDVNKPSQLTNRNSRLELGSSEIKKAFLARAKRAKAQPKIRDSTRAFGSGLIELSRINYIYIIAAYL